MSTPYGFAPVNARSTYLPLEFDAPEDDIGKAEMNADRHRLTANIVNVKENGTYETNEVLTAQQWFSVESPGTAIKTRYTFRTVVNFGALPNATTKSKAHGISVTPGTIFTKILATATYPGNRAVNVPYVNVTTPTDGIELWVDATNVNIRTTTANWVAYTTVYVVLEYIKA